MGVCTEKSSGLKEILEAGLKFTKTPENVSVNSSSYHWDHHPPADSPHSRVLSLSPPQGAPFSPQMFRSPYTPLLNYIPLVQPGFPHQRAPLQLPTSIQDLPAARDGMRFPFPPPYGYGHADLHCSFIAHRGLIPYCIPSWNSQPNLKLGSPAPFSPNAKSEQKYL